MLGGLLTRSDAWNECTAFLQVVSGFTAIEHQGGVEKAEKHNRAGVQHHVNGLPRRQSASDVFEPAHAVARREPADHRGRQQNDGRRKNGWYHAGHIELERQVRGLTAIHLVAHLSARVVDQDFALTALDKHHKVGDQADNDNDKDGHKHTHGASANQLQQTTDGARQARGDAAKNQNRDAVAQAALSDLFTQPHQKHGACGQRDHSGDAKTHTRRHHQTGRGLQRQSDAHGLKQSQAQGAIAGVLGDFATTGLAFFLQLLQRGHHVGHQLHDDGGRDIGHDAQSKHSEARQSATREHIEQTQDAALLSIEQLLQLGRINTGHRNVRTHPVDHQREQQKHQTATQVTVVAVFGCRCRSGQGRTRYFFKLRPPSRQRLQWQLWHPLWHQCH